MNTEPHPSGAPVLNTALTGVTAVYLATDSFEVAALAAALAALFVPRTCRIRVIGSDPAVEARRGAVDEVSDHDAG